MIKNAEEFKRLRESIVPAHYQRASQDEASSETWIDVIQKYPELAFWVAQNKTISTEILSLLADNKNANVRCMVARKRKIDFKIFDKLKADSDLTVRHALICNTKLSNENKKLIKTDDSKWLENELNEKLSK